MPDEDSNQSGAQVALSANQRTTDENSNQMTIRPHALISLHSSAALSRAIPPQPPPGFDESQEAIPPGLPPALTNLRGYQGAIPPGLPPALTIAALFAVDESK